MSGSKLFGCGKKNLPQVRNAKEAREALLGFDVRDFDASTRKVTIAVSPLALRQRRTQLRMDETARAIIGLGIGIAHVHWVSKLHNG